MQNLKLLIQEKSDLQELLAKTHNHKSIAFLNQRLKQVRDRINAFGQRYSVVQVIISMEFADNQKESKIIYYTDISEHDAIEYTRVLYHGMNIRPLEITALNLPVGRLLKIEI